MPGKNTSRIPSYRLHKPSGLAVVRLNGHDFYLGEHGAVESHKKYERLVAEWLSNHRQAIAKRHEGGISSNQLTIDELIVTYWQHAKSYYVKNDRPTTTQQHIREALRPLHELYAAQPAVTFGPLALKTLRQAMIDEARWSRTTINKAVGSIRRVFKWAVENELLPPHVYQGLQAVSGLRRGRSAAPETEPVRPVPEPDVQAVLAHVSRQVATMIQVQTLSGMRPGEVIIMCARDLDTSGKIWIYTPDSHKTEHFGHRRIVYLGPRAQEVIRPFLKRGLAEYLFSPADAETKRRLKEHMQRKTPMSCGNRPGAAAGRRPKRPFRSRYDTNSYRRAIHRACDKVGVPRWSPNQLRHNAGTFLRKEFDIDVARIILGHQSPVMTEIYAERDMAKAAEVMMKIG